MGGLGLAGAFLGGVLALLSPCAALLLPSFFAAAFSAPGRVAARIGAFTVGLLTVLVPLGIGVGAVGRLLTVHRSTATLVGGVVVILLGVYVALGGGFTLPGVDRARGRLDPAGGSWVAVIALGALYGLSGFCSGPLLGAILTLGLSEGSSLYGGLLMAAYGLGMAAPLLLLALVWDRLGAARRWLRGKPIRLGPFRTHTTSLVSGLLLVVIGILFVASDGTTTLPGATDTATQLDWQRRIVDLTGSLSDAVALLLVAALGLAALAWRLLRRP